MAILKLSKALVPPASVGNDPGFDTPSAIAAVAVSTIAATDPRSPASIAPQSPEFIVASPSRSTDATSSSLSSLSPRALSTKDEPLRGKRCASSFGVDPSRAVGDGSAASFIMSSATSGGSATFRLDVSARAVSRLERLELSSPRGTPGSVSSLGGGREARLRSRGGGASGLPGVVAGVRVLHAAAAAGSSLGANRPEASRASAACFRPSSASSASRLRFFLPFAPLASLTMPFCFMTRSTSSCPAAPLTPLGRSVFPARAAAALAASTAFSASSASAGDTSLPEASMYLWPVKCAWNQRARHCCAVRSRISLAMALQLAPCRTRSSAKLRSSLVLQGSRRTRGSRCRRQRPMHC
mmetsp:Transcript_8576/g.35893  ORF Transcript_8576/g.35893 Transcript_8576/m.35893 type:complete len:355 (+) Transcript_8576:1625-2689(+)